MITADALDRMAASHGQTGQPDASLAVLAEILAAQVGFRLFTVLLHDPARNEIRRAFSSRPAEYPVGGAKPITDSPWMQQVLRRGEPYVGRDRHDIRTVFFDYELIWSLGCESVLNLPVRWNGHVIATLNLLHEAHWYDDTVPERLVTLAQLAAPALLSLQGK